MAVAARLLESGIGVRVADRAVTLGEASFARGSVVVIPWVDTRGTARLLLNAMVYGPGLGTSAIIEP